MTDETFLGALHLPLLLSIKKQPYIALKTMHKLCLAQFKLALIMHMLLQPSVRRLESR